MFEHLFNGFVVALIPATLAMLTPLVFSMPPAHCNLSCIPFLKTLWGFKSKRNADAA